MPTNIFWDLNPRRLEPWQRHYEYSEQLRRDEQDYVAWLTGRYVLDAVGAAFDGKQSPYPSEPYSVTQMKQEQEEIATETRIAADKFAAFAMAFNEKFRKKQEAEQNP